MTKLTVAICTLDRPRTLTRTLQSLAQLQDAKEIAVVVVDNSPHRTARAPWADFKASFPGSADYLHVDELGLSVARNAALRHVSSDFVAFIDDDVTLPPHWHTALSAGIQDADVVAAGGPIRLVWDEGRPRWMRERYQRCYSGLDLGDEEHDCDAAVETPYGANFAVNRNRALQEGGFSSELGRVGAGLLGGEEVVLMRALAHFGRVRYLPEAWLYHHVDGSRGTRRWLLRRFYAQGRTEEMIPPAPSAVPGPASSGRRAWWRRDYRVVPYFAAYRLGRYHARYSLRTRDANR